MKKGLRNDSEGHFVPHRAYGAWMGQPVDNKLAAEMTHWNPQAANPAPPVSERLKEHFGSIPQYAYKGLMGAVIGARQYGEAIARGESAEIPEEVRDAALNFAPIGMFAGVGAKTADVAKLGIAQKLEKAGADRADIWNQTGWFKGVDGKWRFEIPDRYDFIDTPTGTKEIGAYWKDGDNSHLSSLYPGGSPQITQHMAMSHEDLFKAYPNLKTTKLSGVSKQGGSYGPASDTVEMDWSDLRRAAYPQKVQDMNQPMSINLHELQHAIQQREGFARGGSPEQFSNVSDGVDVGTAIRSIGKELDAYEKTGRLSGVPAGKESEYLSFLQNKYKELMDKLPHEQYRRLAGEAEARLVQKRMNMTPAERQARPPWMDFDVPEAQQIVRYGDGPNMAIAYHGSPHKFDKFRMDKIGTGEGAQAYGHGLYFAENPKVAGGYQMALSSDRGFSFEGKGGLTRSQVHDLVNAKYGSGYLDNVSRPSGVADALMDDMVTGVLRDSGHLPRGYKQGSQRAELYEKLRKDLLQTETGNLYKVDISDDAVKNFLDWDKPLSQQPESVRALADKIPNVYGPSKHNMNGGDVVKNLEVYMGGKRKASEHLRSLGVPGIRYLDQGSRQGGKGTSNFVVFDEDLVKILSRE